MMVSPFSLRVFPFQSASRSKTLRATGLILLIFHYLVYALPNTLLVHLPNSLVHSLSHSHICPVKGGSPSQILKSKR